MFRARKLNTRRARPSAVAARRRRRSIGVVVAAVAVVASVAGIQPSAIAQEGQIRHAGAPGAIDGSYIVVLKDAVSSKGATSAGTVDATIGRLVARHGGRIAATYRSALVGYSARMGEEQAKRLAADPEVAYVEQDRIVKGSADQLDPPSWGLDRIDQQNLPLNDVYNYDAVGSAVHVYVIDTGLRVTHDDFGSRAEHGRDTVNEDNDVSDCHGHGTHVAGTVGGTEHGVAKGVTLVGVKVLNCQNQGTTTNIIQGVDWVTSHHVKPAVANMSITGGGSGAMDDAVRSSIAAGITYVVAAGNNDDNACDYSPARVSEALTVGATDIADARAQFTPPKASNYGSCLDLFAPGKSIVSAGRASDTATLTMSGTSMASPHVAGAAALYLAKNPGAVPSRVAMALKGDAALNKVTNAGSGSPNRLLIRVKGPVISNLVCEQGNAQYSCVRFVKSGVAPISTRWNRNGTHIAAWDNKTSISGGCQVGTAVAIEAVVTDANGDSDRETRFFACTNDPVP